MRIEDALREVTTGVRSEHGNPIKGKLAHLALDITGDGWQAVAQYWFVKKWNYAYSSDPVKAVLEALGQPVDMDSSDRGEFASKALVVTDFREARADDLSDLLV